MNLRGRLHFHLAAIAALLATLVAVPGTQGDSGRVSVVGGQAQPSALANDEPWAAFCWERIGDGLDCPITITVWVLTSVEPRCLDSRIVAVDCTAPRADLVDLVKYLGPWCESLSPYRAVAYSSTCGSIDAAGAILEGTVPDCTRLQGIEDPLLDAPLCLIWRTGTPPAEVGIPGWEVPDQPPPAFAVTLR